MMDLPEFIQHGARYRFDGMSAQSETRILRRMAPLLAPVIPLILRRGSKPGVHVELRREVDWPKAAGMVLAAYGTLSDADTDLIERSALGALSRQHDEDWMPVWPVGDPEPAFADIDGATMKCLVGNSLGRVIRNWMDKAGDALPPSFRDLRESLH